MKSIKLNFVDFWGDGFDPASNYFYDLLKTKYDVSIDVEDPDIVFFSVGYGSHDIARYKDHRCKKIFYTGENCRPNLDGPYHTTSRGYSTYKCDLAFTFDFLDDDRHYRLPLWALQIGWFGKTDYGNPKFVLPLVQVNNNKYISTPKTKFCATVFNNPVSMRGDMYYKLSRYKEVDGYGRPFNNWFYDWRRA